MKNSWTGSRGKGSFLNDSLRLSATGYTYDWTNKQLIKVSVVQGLEPQKL